MEIAFEPLHAEHLPQMQVWLSRPHVARWWGEPPTLEAVQVEYAGRLSGADPTHCYIVRLDGRPVGMVQTYQWDQPDNTQESAEIGALPGEAGVDYFIGEPDLIGRGLGPLILTRFLDEIVFADPDVTGVRVPIDMNNVRSWRCLEKLGFDRGDAVPRHGGEVQYIPALRRAQRSAAGQTSR
jgi:aminoglycoside 6'-N-acetyltransferase